MDMMEYNRRDSILPIKKAGRFQIFLPSLFRWNECRSSPGISDIDNKFNTPSYFSSDSIRLFKMSNCLLLCFDGSWRSREIADLCIC